MKSVLCFGDSNTWGYTADSLKNGMFSGAPERYPYDVRWPGVMQNALGKDYYVIEEGLNGRTTAKDDTIEPDKNGSLHLPMILATHAPLDLVILALGCNDLKEQFNLSPWMIAFSQGLLVNIIRQSGCGVQGGTPKILLMSPALLGDFKGTPLEFMFGGEAQAKSQQLAKEYAAVAKKLDLEFIDAGLYAHPGTVDAIHLTPESHKKLGLALADKVRAILA